MTQAIFSNQSLQPITFIVALALIVLGSFGGGIEIQSVKIPPLPALSRVLSVAIGVSLLALSLAIPKFLPTPAPTPTPAPVPSTQPAPPSSSSACPDEKPGAWNGAAIANGIVTVQDVKKVLRHVGNYSGSMNECADSEFHKAVSAFQQTRGLDPDGYVGPKTYAKLQEAWPDYFDLNRAAK